MIALLILCFFKNCRLALLAELYPHTQRLLQRSIRQTMPLTKQDRLQHHQRINLHQHVVLFQTLRQYPKDPELISLR